VTGLFNDLENLTILLIKWNPIEELDDGTFTGLKKLSYLDISAIQITSLHPDLFRDLVSMKVLIISMNFIKELDEKVFGNLFKLEKLNLRSNQLEYLPEKLFENLTSLKKLYMNKNPIKALHENQFKYLVNLEVLEITTAQLTTVPDGIFKNNGNLMWISLQANISRMSNKVFSHLTKLDSIYLGNNYCVSLEIKEHNLSVFFTEELLIPCSCKLLKNEYSGFQFVGLLIFGTLVTASTISILLVKKTKILNNWRTMKGTCQSLIILKMTLLMFIYFKVFRKTVKEYLNNTSIHGLSYVANGRSLLITR
jgi:Leucine-rich repeat (LRR) protein